MFAKLSVDSLEAREVPAVLGWYSVGPQPEPPTKLLPAVQITAPSKVGAVPSDPVLSGWWSRIGAVPSDPVIQSRLQSPSLPAVGILLPALRTV